MFEYSIETAEGFGPNHTFWSANISVGDLDVLKAPLQFISASRTFVNVPFLLRNWEVVLSSKATDALFNLDESLASAIIILSPFAIVTSVVTALGAFASNAVLIPPDVTAFVRRKAGGISEKNGCSDRYLFSS